MGRGSEELRVVRGTYQENFFRNVRSVLRCGITIGLRYRGVCSVSANPYRNSYMSVNYRLRRYYGDRVRSIENAVPHGGSGRGRLYPPLRSGNRTHGSRSGFGGDRSLLGDPDTTDSRSYGLLPDLPSQNYFLGVDLGSTDSRLL